MRIFTVAATAVASTIAAAFAWSAARSTARSASDAVKRGGTFKARLTTYHPLDVSSDAERKMEGKPVDRKGRPLHYLEDAANGSTSFVDVSGDPKVFPYGQALRIAELPGILFRVTDTGSHFMGAKKVYRVAGAEPLDIAVRSSSTKVPQIVTVAIEAGNTLDKPGATVATDKFKGQTVIGLDLLGLV